MPAKIIHKTYYVISKNRDEFYLTIFVITLQEHFVYGSKHYVMTDQVRFLGKCPPTPPLSQY